MIEEIEEIQSYLEITCSDNPEEITQRIRELSAYLARTAFLLRDARYALRRKKASEIGDIVVKIAKEQYLSAKAQNALVDSIAADEHRIVDWLDRLNAACTHQLDALRSLLSYEKEQLRLRDTGY